MAELIEFETERLCLRQWQKSDFQPFAALNADPKVMEYFPEPLSSQASIEMAEKIGSLIEQRGWGFWAVEVKGAKSFIGFCGLHVPTATLPFSPCVEIGWRLSAAHWGKGYASEAACGALNVAFQQLELPEIVSFTAVGNQRSRRVMERIGMNYSGQFEHPGVPENSPLRPHVLYRLRREQWGVQPATTSTALTKHRSINVCLSAHVRFDSPRWRSCDVGHRLGCYIGTCQRTKIVFEDDEF